MKWEYMVFAVSERAEHAQQELNELGLDGWELVVMHSDTGFAYLKRPMPKTEAS